ncbi:unnamed protein product [Amoebophrya sp. A25]|nr:unnamed protein product [Amoebophrya sp. A25]|eukprot:GSA25T00012964001.1
MNGDICRMDNLEYIKNFFSDAKKVHLYTSDAGIGLDIDEFAEQEKVEFKLKLAEVVCALLTLKTGGNMMIKMYTFFEKLTIDVLILLGFFFRELKIVKPLSSKPTNSEVYLVGKGFEEDDQGDQQEALNGNAEKNCGGSTTSESERSTMIVRQRILNLFLEKIEHFEDTSCKDPNGFDLGFLPPAAIQKADIATFTGASSQIYLKQAVWVNRNLFFMHQHWIEKKGQFTIKSVNDANKVARRIQNGMKPLVQRYLETFIDQYDFYRALEDDENEVLF